MGGLTFLIGTVVLGGWMLGFGELKSVVPGWPKMSPLTALAFVVCGVALWAEMSAASPARAGRNFWITQASAGLAIGLGALKLADHLFAWNLGIDRLGFGDVEPLASMAPGTALNFVLLGSALLLGSRRQQPLLFQFTTFFAGMLGWLALSRYFFGGDPLLPLAQMAVHTSTTFVLLSAGVLCVRADIGLVELLASDSAGGSAVRRLLPAAVSIPFVVGWLRLLGQRAGWFGLEGGLSLFALANVVVFALLVWAHGRLLHQADDRRRQAEESRRTSQELLHAITNNSTAVIYVKDVAGRYLLVNRQYEQLFHLAASAIVGRTDHELFAKEAADAFRDVDRQVITGGKLIETEETAPLDDGPHTYISIKFPLRDANGEVFALGGVSTDITERKHAEQRIHTQLERLQLLHQLTRAIGERQDLRSIYQVMLRGVEENLPLDFGCVCLYDPVDKALTVTCVGKRSHALAEELAMTEQARIAIDQNGLSRCVNGHLVYEPDLSVSAHPFPQRLRRGGLGALVIAPMRVESGVFGVLVAARCEVRSFSSSDCEFLRQLSEHTALAAHQAQLYGALQHAYNDMRQTQQAVLQQERLSALGQMASGIAHDINNAITPAALYAEALLEQESNLSANAREQLGIIQRALHDIGQTIARMSEFYRKRDSQPVLAAVDANRMVRQVAELSRARWHDMPQQRGVVIRLSLDLTQELPKVLGVESEVREALLNLVFNAVDAMPEGGTLTLRTRVIGEAPAYRQVHVEVVDTGIGMSEEARRRCFEPFFTTKGERGTGLGLAMVYGMAQRHGAELQVESVIGRGTTIRLCFTVAAAEPVPTLRSETGPALRARLRLLVIDDDPILIKSLCDILEADGHRVVAAHDGQDGIDTFQRSLTQGETFAAVITDLGMPYVDGRKVASEIKAASPATPVILLTGWGQRLVTEGDVPPHVDLILAKPPKLRELREALAHCTEKRT